MKFETLKKNYTKKIIIGLVGVLAISIVGIIATSKAKYRNTQSIPLVRGIITGTSSDLNIMAVYLENKDGEWEQTNKIPTNGYTFNETESKCLLNGEKDENVVITYSKENGITVSKLFNKGEKCNFYFDRDKEAPVVNDFTTSATGSSITITVDASDNIGIAKYYYVIDGGTSIDKATNTHTFTGLTAGQSYSITVYVSDGVNESEKVTKTITAVGPADIILSKLKVTVNKEEPDFNKTAGTTQTASVLGNYYTYADSYTYDEITKKYSLVNPKVCQYSSCYSTLKEKYIGSITGSSASVLENYTDLNNIYYIDETNSSTIYYARLDYYDIAAGIYSAIDETGKVTYYYRGAPKNNYLKFANKWWRIVRINGDGTIRIIYDGTAYHMNGTSTTDSIAVVNQSFSKNNAYNHNTYVGFMTGSTSVTATYEETHINCNKSNAVEQLETWYKTNLLNYTDKIDKNAGFCGDRRSSTNSSTPDGTGGTGTTTTYYGAYFRLRTSNQNPILTCNDNDLYTIKEATRGNKSLEYPIGLISADEIAMAGGKLNYQNRFYYLYNGQNYWTISPAIGSTASTAFHMNNGGDLSTYGVNQPFGLRPVINLRADVTITGSGTGTDPYVVS